MKRSLVRAVAALTTGSALIGATLVACGDDSAKTVDAGGADASRDAPSSSMTDDTVASTMDGSGGNTTDGSMSATDAGVTDTGVDVNTVDSGPVLNGCASYTDYTDHTGVGQLDLTWGFGISTDPNRCAIIHAGATVTWTGDFVTHPIEAFNGDPMSPIDGTQITDNGDGTGTVTANFMNAGDFGYHCKVHAFMQGVIRVVP